MVSDEDMQPSAASATNKESVTEGMVCYGFQMYFEVSLDIIYQVYPNTSGDRNVFPENYVDTRQMEALIFSTSPPHQAVSMFVRHGWVTHGTASAAVVEFLPSR